MNARLFGRTGHTVGEIGLGCWQLGGTDWTGISDMRARSILTAAADSGVNFFDTADVYGSGRSEEVLGQFLRDRKEGLLVATKVGRASGMYPSGYTWDAIRTATEASLKRLGIPCLHLTQLHCVPAEVLKQGAIFEFWGQRRDHRGGFALPATAGACIPAAHLQCPAARTGTGGLSARRRERCGRHRQASPRGWAARRPSHRPAAGTLRIQRKPRTRADCTGR